MIRFLYSIMKQSLQRDHPHMPKEKEWWHSGEFMPVKHPALKPHTGLVERSCQGQRSLARIVPMNVQAQNGKRSLGQRVLHERWSKTSQNERWQSSTNMDKHWNSKHQTSANDMWHRLAMVLRLRHSSNFLRWYPALYDWKRQPRASERARLSACNSATNSIS